MGTERGAIREKRKQQKWLRALIIGLGFLILLGFLYKSFWFFLTFCADLRVAAAIKWEYNVTGEAWSFQREYTTVTDQGGTLIPIVNEGERVSKGLEIARLNYGGGDDLREAGNRRLYSQVAGILSYEADGLEMVSMRRDYSNLTVAMIEERLAQAQPAREGQGLVGILQEKMASEAGQAEDQGGQAAGAGQAEAQAGRQGGLASGETPAPAQPATEPKAVEAGGVVLKIIDNLSDCYVYIRLPANETAPFAVADSVTMRLVGGDGSGKGTVLEREILPGETGWGVLVKLEAGLEPIRHGRRHEVVLILGSQDKAAVERGAVTLRDGEQGVYLLQGGVAHWKRVEIVGEENGRLILDGLASGDIVVSRPWFIFEGMRLGNR
ncbi:MAG: hypothetical protein LBK98_04240 [Peptococcaceae bacterium]|jgi:hypothetical protein|nr:hypothetical protein [Peptococcaceae bacterium]